MTSKILAPLTSFRFFAALLVVIFHYPRKDLLFPTTLANFGYGAVVFFFVLSGFVLTYAHLEDGRLNVTPQRFILSRAARILPSYFLALALAAPFFLSKGELKAAPFVLSITQAWIPAFALQWNAPAWSLSNEMFFYALYPLFIWAIIRMKNAAFPFTAAAVVAVAWWREIYFISDGWANFLFYFPLLNLPQFLLGAAIALSAKGCRPHHAVMWIGLAALAAAVSLGYTNTAILSSIFGLIIFGAISHPNFLSSAPLLLLGDASYALYILHVPLRFWWDRITRVDLAIDIPPIIDFSLYLGLVIAASVFVLIWLEKPCRTWLIRTSNLTRSRDNDLRISSPVRPEA